MPGQRRRGSRIDWTSRSVTRDPDTGEQVQTVTIPPGDGRMSRAVAEALESAPTLPRDAGAVELARRYAALIDEAAPAAKYRKPLGVLRAAARLCEGGDDAYKTIATALGEHSVASDLGPKLLAALTALGMTAAGRSAKGGAADGPKVPDELGELRARARDRRAR